VRLALPDAKPLSRMLALFATSATAAGRSSELCSLCLPFLGLPRKMPPSDYVALEN
jgi:hypothetical protein